MDIEDKLNGVFVVTSIDESLDTEFYAGFAFDNMQVEVNWNGRSVSEVPVGKTYIIKFPPQELEKGKIRKPYKTSVNGGAYVSKGDDGSANGTAFVEFKKRDDKGSSVTGSLTGTISKKPNGKTDTQVGVQLGWEKQF